MPDCAASADNCTVTNDIQCDDTSYKRGSYHWSVDGSEARGTEEFGIDRPTFCSGTYDVTTVRQ